MENTGNGANENTTARVDTAELLGPSPLKDKPNTGKTEKSITPDVAGELLSSALDYCRKAGLKVLSYNESDGFAVLVTGLHDTGAGIIPLVTPKVTPKEPVTP